MKEIVIRYNVNIDLGLLNDFIDFQTDPLWLKWALKIHSINWDPMGIITKMYYHI